MTSTAVTTALPADSLEYALLADWAEENVHLTLDDQNRLYQPGAPFAVLVQSMVDRFRAGNYGIIPVYEADDQRQSVQRNSGFIRGVYYDRKQKQVELTQTLPDRCILVDTVAPADRIH